MKIGLDIMSGDNAPLSNINGAIRYINNPKSNKNMDNSNNVKSIIRGS